MNVLINKYRIASGAFSTLVSINTDDNGLSFFLRDINKQYPVYITEYKVLVTAADDTRSFDDIVKDLNSVRGFTKLDECKYEPEESFENATKKHQGYEMCYLAWDKPRYKNI